MQLILLGLADVCVSCEAEGLLRIYVTMPAPESLDQAISLAKSYILEGDPVVTACEEAASECGLNPLLVKNRLLERVGVSEDDLPGNLAAIARETEASLNASLPLRCAAVTTALANAMSGITALGLTPTALSGRPFIYFGDKRTYLYVHTHTFPPAQPGKKLELVIIAVRVPDGRLAYLRVPDIQIFLSELRTSL